MVYKSRIGKLDFKRKEVCFEGNFMYFVYNEKYKLMDKISREEFLSLDLPEGKLI